MPLAEFERSLMRERTMAGLAASRARGRVGGCRPALNVAQLAQPRRWRPQERRSEIADLLGAGRSTLYRVLRSIERVPLN